MSNREIVQAILDAAYKAHGDEIFVSDGYAYCENVLTAFVKELNKRDEQIAALTLERDNLLDTVATLNHDWSEVTAERDKLKQDLQLALSDASIKHKYRADCLERQSEALAKERDELQAKGESLCCQNGTLLVENHGLRKKFARYREALLHLAKETKGFLSQANVDDHGVTNIRCLERVSARQKRHSKTRRSTTMKPKIDWEQLRFDFARNGTCGLFTGDEELIRKLVEAELKRKKTESEKES